MNSEQVVHSLRTWERPVFIKFGFLQQQGCPGNLGGNKEGWNTFKTTQQGHKRFVLPKTTQDKDKS